MASRLSALVRVAAAVVATAVTPLLAACGDDEAGGGRSADPVVTGEQAGEDNHPGTGDSDWSKFAVEPLPAPPAGGVEVPEPAARVACPSPTISEEALRVRADRRLRAALLARAGRLVWRRSDNRRARALLEESLALERELGDPTLRRPPATQPGARRDVGR